jgi:hypothetical protein
MNAYRVEAEWGLGIDDGTYVTWVWAENPEAAQRACIAEMNDCHIPHPTQADRDDEDYDILCCELLEDHLAWMEQQVVEARVFLAKRPS